ncbi:MAG: hypothetical protein AB4911_02845 [Oscillochloridaceae bacterium umkhey_bin13]
MPDSLIFIGVARSQGYPPEAAVAALAAVRARLAEAQITTRRFYIYRTGDGGVGSAGATSQSSGRPRLLLAFQSPDDALAFAQATGLGSSPRLVPLSLGQILAAIIQRPAIVALLIAESTLTPLIGGLPPGLRIERAALIELLAGVIS